MRMHIHPNPDARAEQAETSAHGLLSHLRVSLIATIVLAIIVGGVYPAIVWALGQLLFPHRANGSLIGKDGNPVSNDGDAAGSALIGQAFSGPKYFHPRPSSAGNGYDPTASGGSNLGPTSARLINGSLKKDDKGNEIVDYDGIRDRIVHYCVEDGLPFESSVPLERFRDAGGNLDDVKLIQALNDDKAPLLFRPKIEIPADAVTASGSGLDPHISVANAKIQAGRVAGARRMKKEDLRRLIDKYTEPPDLGFLGEPRVNVLRLNIALDQETR